MSAQNSDHQALLVLEDGTVFPGRNFGAEGKICGEVVFNTAMTGYQEIATDPSYYGQMVTMTYPLIGNYGINTADVESRKPYISAMIVREIARRHSNFRSEESIQNYFERHDIIGIEEVDTRALVLHIRNKGAMRGIISTEDSDINSLLSKVRSSPEMSGRDCVQYVTIDKSYSFPNDSVPLDPAPPEPDFHVVVYDFGVKFNILRQLAYTGIRTTVVPSTTPAAEVRALKPDGLFLSNGPGDPDALPSIVAELRQLVPEYPTFGICLGCQLMGLTLGGKTAKLKFGHRGANHPVKDLETGRIEITSQNHGFYVVMESLPQDDLEVTHINLNDNTVEGLRHKTLPMFSVQYHPEASPGPHDSHYLFRRFYDMIKASKS
ncbi:glutamine-hydrolyzing carbamoyl-phosphate synthase small subunit [Candidatus Sumerlaeota bacterium]|nr:glutamine-hydrolyzing carbamoyl-phosphate synthase small subunit [Candidatus Sumerlaeota bacterium]